MCNFANFSCLSLLYLFQLNIKPPTAHIAPTVDPTIVHISAVLLKPPVEPLLAEGELWVLEDVAEPDSAAGMDED